MKKLNLSLLAILIIAALTPRLAFSMVPQESQFKDTDEFKYFEADGNHFRKVNNTGQFQRRVGMEWELPDGTMSNDYQWVASAEPSPAMNLETTSKEENNNNFE